MMIYDNIGTIDNIFIKFYNLHAQFRILSSIKRAAKTAYLIKHGFSNKKVIRRKIIDCPAFAFDKAISISPASKKGFIT